MNKFYWHKESTCIPSSICRWNLTTVQMGYLELPIHDVFKICFKVTTDSNVQWLQYRILYRLLPVKSYLKKIKIVDNDTCSFCKAPVTLDRIEPPNVKRIRIFVIRWCSSIFVLCPFYVRNIRFMCGDVRFVRQHPLESFVHAQKLKRMVTNMNIRWLSCACPFCPVYLLLLFAIHSLDVRGSFLLYGDVRRYPFYVRSMFVTFFSCAVVSFISFSFLSTFFFCFLPRGIVEMQSAFQLPS